MTRRHQVTAWRALSARRAVLDNSKQLVLLQLCIDLNYTINGAHWCNHVSRGGSAVAWLVSAANALSWLVGCAEELPGRVSFSMIVLRSHNVGLQGNQSIIELNVNVAVQWELGMPIKSSELRTHYSNPEKMKLGAQKSCKCLRGHYLYSWWYFKSYILVENFWRVYVLTIESFARI